MNATKMTETQMNLWEIANKELRQIGGTSGILRNHDKNIRNAGNTEGTREWALLQSVGLSSGRLSDEECEKLINIITSKA